MIDYEKLDNYIVSEKVKLVNDMHLEEQKRKNNINLIKGKFLGLIIVQEWLRSNYGER